MGDFGAMKQNKDQLFEFQMPNQTFNSKLNTQVKMKQHT